MKWSNRWTCTSKHTFLLHSHSHTSVYLALCIFDDSAVRDAAAELTVKMISFSFRAREVSVWSAECYRDQVIKTHCVFSNRIRRRRTDVPLKSVWKRVTSGPIKAAHASQLLSDRCEQLSKLTIIISSSDMHQRRGRKNTEWIEAPHPQEIKAFSVLLFVVRVFMAERSMVTLWSYKTLRQPCLTVSCPASPRDCQGYKVTYKVINPYVCCRFPPVATGGLRKCTESITGWQSGR